MPGPKPGKDKKNHSAKNFNLTKFNFPETGFNTLTHQCQLPGYSSAIYNITANRG